MGGDMCMMRCMAKLWALRCGRQRETEGLEDVIQALIKVPPPPPPPPTPPIASVQLPASSTQAENVMEEVANAEEGSWLR